MLKETFNDARITSADILLKASNNLLIESIQENKHAQPFTLLHLYRGVFWVKQHL